MRSAERKGTKVSIPALDTEVPATSAAMMFPSLSLKLLAQELCESPLERERERDEVRSRDEMNEERAYLYTTMFLVALAVAS